MCGLSLNRSFWARANAKALQVEARWLSEPGNQQRDAVFAEEQRESAEQELVDAREHPTFRAPDALVALPSATVLNAAAIDIEPGELRVVAFRPSGVQLEGANDVLLIPWADVVEIQIGGPGRTTRGSNFIGGGFGFQGAAEGMLAAGLLNAATRRSSIETVVGLLFRQAELWLLYEHLEPLALRVELAPAFARLRAENFRRVAGE
ncbi:MAG: hypothetical protein QOH72_4083 [Solirubrobacteraceae bacterium]|jgi:hypothetical protein|nr:hypothetical protein [Solirubrobacteraceae bacterium]